MSWLAYADASRRPNIEATVESRTQIESDEFIQSMRRGAALATDYKVR
jgi:hypothetical protein